jgi:hypothetical protein
MNRIFGLTGVLILLFSLSCTKKLEDPGATSTVAMSNEWWVTLKIGTNDLIGTHVKFATYNTSTNVADSLWLDDLMNGYQFKCKVLTNPKNGTFAVDSSQNLYYDIRVHITNGKIIPNGGLSKTGIVCDSIYMEANFGDDPVNTYIISGTARTRWAGDDY